MKLPETKKERIQIIALIGIGIVGAGYMLIQLAIKPIMESSRTSRERLVELQEKVSQAERYLKQTERKKREGVELVQRLTELSSTDILEDEVGNFLLPAQAIVKEWARTAGIDDIEVRQVGFERIPQPKTAKTERPFRIYTVRTTALTGYEQVLAFARIIEEQNPYASVGGIHITTTTDPLKHTVVMDIRWPVWASDELKQEVLDPEAFAPAEGGAG